MQFFLTNKMWGTFHCCASLYVGKNSNTIAIDGYYPTDSEGKDFNFLCLYWEKKKKKKEASETNSLTFSSLEPQALY